MDETLAWQQVSIIVSLKEIDMKWAHEHPDRPKKIIEASCKLNIGIPNHTKS